VLLIAVLWFVPQLQGRYFSHGVSSKEIPALVNEYRRTWAQIIGGFALLLGLYFTWRRVEISQRTLETAQDQQVTERFTRAIDQLGATDDNGSFQLEIRLGGIYALERIARDSERDHWPIMEVLTAYVRQHAPRRPEGGQGDEAEAVVEKKTVEDSTDDTDTTEVATPDPDIQAIMTVIRRRTRSFGHGEPERIHLRETDLTRAELWGAELSGAEFLGAELWGANLSGANLSGAFFLEANLWGAELSEADLSRADLSGTELLGANLSGANLSDATLHEALLFEVNLSGADLTDADLTDADLTRADLSEANFWGADLSGADLSEANLWGADLSGARNVTQAQLEESAAGNEATRLPSDCEPPTNWGGNTDEQIEKD